MGGMVIFIPPELEHRRWGDNPIAAKAFEDAARKQGIPLLTWGELQALYERGTDEEEEALWGGIFDDFTAEP